MQPVVQKVGLNTPPGAAGEGQMWVVGARPTGTWSGQANRVAQRIGGAWVYSAPFTGLIVFDAATLAQWGWNGAAWALVVPRLMEGSASHDPLSIAAGSGITTTITVTGATLGDYARASFSLNLQGILLTAWVSAAGIVSVRFQNGTAAAVDLANGTLRIRVER